MKLDPRYRHPMCDEYKIDHEWHGFRGLRARLLHQKGTRQKRKWSGFYFEVTDGQFSVCSVYDKFPTLLHVFEQAMTTFRELGLALPKLPELGHWYETTGCEAPLVLITSNSPIRGTYGGKAFPLLPEQLGECLTA